MVTVARSATGRSGLVGGLRLVEPGGGGGGVGLGGGVSVPVGGGRADEVVATELRVQLKRRSDNTVVWEGRATTETLGNAPTTQPGATAQRLAGALFKGFPGESGITITVK